MGAITPCFATATVRAHWNSDAELLLVQYSTGQGPVFPSISPPEPPLSELHAPRHPANQKQTAPKTQT